MISNNSPAGCSSITFGSEPQLVFTDEHIWPELSRYLCREKLCLKIRHRAKSICLCTLANLNGNHLMVIISKKGRPPNFKYVIQNKASNGFWVNFLIQLILKVGMRPGGGWMGQTQHFHPRDHFHNKVENISNPRVMGRWSGGFPLDKNQASSQESYKSYKVLNIIRYSRREGDSK